MTSREHLKFEQLARQLARQLRESPKDIEHRTTQFLQGPNQIGVPLMGRRFIQRHAHLGGLRCYANLRLRKSRRNPPAFDYRAIFRRSGAEVVPDRLRDASVPEFDGRLRLSHSYRDYRYSSVPIEIAKLVEHPKDVLRAGIFLAFPIERLEPLDLWPEFGVDTANLVLAGAVVRLATLTLKWPVDALPNNGPSGPFERMPRIGNGQLPDKVVEGVSHIANHVTDSEDDLGRSVLTDVEHGVITRSLRFEVGRDFYGIALTEDLYPLLESVQVNLCPDQLLTGGWQPIKRRLAR